MTAADLKREIVAALATSPRRAPLHARDAYLCPLLLYRDASRPDPKWQSLRWLADSLREPLRNLLPRLSDAPETIVDGIDATPDAMIGGVPVVLFFSLRSKLWDLGKRGQGEYQSWATQSIMQFGGWDECWAIYYPVDSGTPYVYHATRIDRFASAARSRVLGVQTAIAEKTPPECTCGRCRP